MEDGPFKTELWLLFLSSSLLSRQWVSFDTVTITPTSKNGYTAIVVIVNHFTHLTYLHPVKDHTAEAVCEALMRYGVILAYLMSSGPILVAN